jgi:hypothetical protein
MKVPLLSRCFMTTPAIIFDDTESISGESATTMLIGCEVGSSCGKTTTRKRNVFIQWRQKVFRSDRDNTTAARQALGLDTNKLSESKNAESVLTKGTTDIDCKGLHYQSLSTQSLPPTNNGRDQIHTNITETNSLPPKSSTRRRSSVDSSHSVMDESCSGHSILDELLMEVYKDPYEDFLQKLKSSKRMQEKIDEIEVDVLTQLPAIKTNSPPKRHRSRRSLAHHTASSTRAIISSRSNTCQDSKPGPESRNDEIAQSTLPFLKNGTFCASLF